MKVLSFSAYIKKYPPPRCEDHEKDRSFAGHCGDCADLFDQYEERYYKHRRMLDEMGVEVTVKIVPATDASNSVEMDVEEAFDLARALSAAADLAQEGVVVSRG